jgi:UDP-glucuronate decarboxylase
VTGNGRDRVLGQDLDCIVQRRLPFDLLEGRTVLVSGAGGMLAGYLVETLLHLNETRFTAPSSKIRVLALVRDGPRARERFRRYDGATELSLLVQDVCAPVAVGGAIDVIVHAASPASPKDYARDPAGTLDANVLGTRNLLELAHAKGSERFLFFSSSEVYGQHAGDSGPLAETDFGRMDPGCLRSCYGEGKRVGETLCFAWHYQFGVPAIIVRPFHTYGPGMRLDDGRVFADFVADVVCGREIAVLGPGSAVRAFCYVADATSGFLTALLKGEPGQAYNVGNSAGSLSVLDLARLLVRLFPERSPGVRLAACAETDYPASTIASAIPDTSKLGLLGWSPAVPPAEGFRRTVESFL